MDIGNQIDLFSEFVSPEASPEQRGFASWFEALTGHPPFRWQTRLFERFIAADDPPTALDLPTGLGKTSVLAVWLLARACNPRLPRRLVYVVDRRAVVDQATAEAEKLRKALATVPELAERLGLNGRPLPVSTLRGQYADNREWLADPALPAVIVGTLDMIGSRLLFEGYGVGRGMRPYQAGLLGADTLLVLDEAHLCPPFEALLRTVPGVGLASRADGGLIPPFHLLSLSATGRGADETAFRLGTDD
jgi:CRISPR-associated endonuclease/helicase Cas3